MGEKIARVEVLCPSKENPVWVKLSVCKGCQDCLDIFRNGEDYEVKVICDYRERLQRERGS
jgi:hypothetical protein